MLFFIIIQTSFVLPLLFFLIYKRKNNEAIVRIILFYILYCIAQEALTYLFSFKPELYAYLRYLFGSYTVIEFSLFCIFYYYLFPKEHKVKWVTISIAVAFVIFAALDFFVFSKHQNLGSLTIGIEALILILLCGYYLYYQVTTSMSMLVYRTFNFWVIVTFLMYVSSTFFLYLMTDAMGTDSEFRQYYFIINLGANALKNVLLAFAITRKTVLSPQSDTPPPPAFDLDLGDEILLQQNM